MTAIPNTLALRNIADGASIVASDHRNNYTDIQTEANALLGILDDGATGKTLQGTSTTLSWDYPPGYQWDVKTGTAPVTIASSTEATPTAVLTGNSVSYDGTQVMIDFSCPDIGASGATAGIVIINAWRDTTNLGRIQQVPFGASLDVAGVYGRIFDTPAAGAHTYKIQAYYNTAQGVIQAGAGGAAYAPMVMRVTKV